MTFLPQPSHVLFSDYAFQQLAHNRQPFREAVFVFDLFQAISAHPLLRDFWP